MRIYARVDAEKIEYRHCIDSAFAKSSDGGKFELKSLYNHEKITDICEDSVEDTNRAVAAAKAAFPAWSAKSPAERGALLEALAAKVRATGTEFAQLNPMDMGRPIRRERAKAYLEAGKAGSGKLLTGGEVGEGNFIEPTVFEDKEEVFGPFINNNTFKTEAKVLEKGNATEYGLIYQGHYRAMRLAKGLESGTVGINCTIPAMAFDMLFGGYKGSAQAREGFGNSIGEHLEIKTVLIKRDENSEGII
ncbi:hypothetical protein AC578_5881 [Pseudocercospora eumusae]|uniref:aldehyde dehydrogenase (NAD(+)) n=1 Tax=Pseudocercospora eumusae TaxID=321146 RepID=A0A139HD00_9PEZI|nr:hypothetical protein AC578_5881 [Pseudocercospora eumusae]